MRLLPPLVTTSPHAPVLFGRTVAGPAHIGTAEIALDHVLCRRGSPSLPGACATIKSDVRRASPLLIAAVPVRDLLLRAKDLFIAAIVAGIHRTEIDRTATDARAASGGPRVGPCPTPLGTLARGYSSRIKLGVPKIYKIQKSRSPSAASSWSGTRQVLYSITKHAMRRSADEIGATSISFRPKAFSDATSVVDGIFSAHRVCTTRINRAHGA